MEATLEAVRKLEEEGGLDIVGVTVGCESVSCPWAWIRFEFLDKFLPDPRYINKITQGVELSDIISTRLGKKGLQTNGEELSHHRRDKYLMGER